MRRHNFRGSRNRTAHIRVDHRKCEACSACEEVCKNSVLKVSGIWFHRHVHVIDAEKCKGCKKCVEACPEGAITPVLKKGDEARVRR